MKFGFFLASNRHNNVAAESWDEDLWEVLTAEQLGFEETWVAEHIGGMRPDMMPVVDLFICKAAALTKHMRFGPGIRSLPFHHPVEVATQAAMCDHLTGGRYMAGFGGGAGLIAAKYFGQLGMDHRPEEARDMMHEAIELILRCWSETEPFDFQGTFWHGRGIKVEPKPLQQPRMPVAMANSESVSTAEFAGKMGFQPLHSQYDGPWNLRELADVFVDAARASGRESSRKDIRICRTVWVSDSVKRAKDEIRDDVAPAIEEAKRGPALHHVVRSLPAGGKVEDVTFDFLADTGVYCVGDPDTVYERIKALYDEIGGFGALLFVTGRGVGTREQRERSWSLFMEHVAPRLVDLDPDRPDGVNERSLGPSPKKR